MKQSYEEPLMVNDSTHFGHFAELTGGAYKTVEGGFISGLVSFV